MLGPENKQPHPKALPAMIGGLLTLLEDQHILNGEHHSLHSSTRTVPDKEADPFMRARRAEIPFELAKVLHLNMPGPVAHTAADATRSLLSHLHNILPHA